MVQPVDALVGMFADAGASYITFHLDASTHVDRTLQLIRNAGCKSGLVFNPASNLDALKYVLDKVDMILLMSVNPGFGGQSFIPSTLDKLREARSVSMSQVWIFALRSMVVSVRLTSRRSLKLAQIPLSQARLFSVSPIMRRLSSRCATSWPRSNDPNLSQTAFDA